MQTDKTSALTAARVGFLIEAASHVEQPHVNASTEAVSANAAGPARMGRGRCGRAALLGFWEERVLGAFWRLLVRLAVDATDDADSRSVLVLAPHPDDESLGCGGSIARRRAAGIPVWVLLATDGSRSHRSAVITPVDLRRIRREEFVEACAILGVPSRDVSLLGFEDSTLERETESLRGAVRRELLARRPDELLVPSRFDGHPDHRALNAAGRAAVAGLGWNIPVLEYPVWFATAAAWTTPGRGRVFQAWQLLTGPFRLLLACRMCAIDVGAFRSHKRRAIAAHRSQTTRLSGEADWAVLEPAFVERFVGARELFFTSRARSVRRVPARAGARSA